MNHQTTRAQVLKALGVLLLVRLVFIYFKPFDCVSLDIHYWQEVVARLLTEPTSNPYVTTSRLNHPPFWLIALFFMGKASISTGIALQHLVQGLLILSECAISLVLLLMCSVRLRVVLVAGALNPIAILLSCQHLNFDSLVGFWLLLFAAALVQFSSSKDPQDWLLACLFLGLGMFTKTIPIVLLPFLAYNARSLSIKVLMLGSALLFLPLGIGMGIILALGEKGVLVNVIQYRSIPAPIGFSGITYFLSKADAAAFSRTHGSIFFLVLLCTLVGLSKIMRESKAIEAKSLVLLISGTLCLIPALGPGYGPQYIYWFMPMLIYLYHLESEGVRKLLLTGFFLASITYITDYSLVPAYGASVSYWLDPDRAKEWIATFNEPLVTYLFHLPLFIWYLTFVTVAGKRALVVERASRSIAG
jgi:hypothetical protein